jgi:NAD(P)-dependent dehydrogenase (short-subunit alcohol dehydrogenase family)
VEKLEALSAEYALARYGVLDATNAASVDSFVAECATNCGPIRGLVNLAGSIILKPAHLTTDEELRACLDTNLVSAFNVVRAAGRRLANNASVVLMSSSAAQIGLANHEAIAAAKAGVEGLVRSAAATYAAKGIRFNAIAPGLVKTPLSEKITSSSAAEAFSRSLHPLGRLGEAADIASAIGFLLSDEASWITGQVLGVDGGLGRIKLGK